MFKYMLVGGSAFLTEYLSFLIIYYLLHAQIYAANSISFILGLTVSFTFNRAWTFKAGDYHHKRHHQLGMYSMLAVFNLILTNIIIGMLKGAGFDPRLAKFMVMFLIIIWNFLIFRGVIFKQKA